MSVRFGPFLLLMLALLLAGRVQGDEPDLGRAKQKLGQAMTSSALEREAGEDVATPRTPSELLVIFLANPKYNAYVLRNPDVLPALMDRITEPRFFMAGWGTAAAPEVYLNFMQGWTDIEKMRSYWEVADPEVISAWWLQMGNPNFYAVLVRAMTNPGKLGRWAAFLTNPAGAAKGPPCGPEETFHAWFSLPWNPTLYRHLETPIHWLSPAQPGTVAAAFMGSASLAWRRFEAPPR
ncbi:MAG: hypothetical protein ACLPXB_11440 [Thiobacillaceae bacterium]